MLISPTLTDKDVSDFGRDGYLIVRGAFPVEQMNAIAAWTDELLAMPEESGKHWVYHEPSLVDDGEDLVSRIENIGPFHPGFRQLSDVLKAPVGQLIGEEAVLFKEKINFKMPGGDGFKPHQDSQAGWDRYADFSSASWSPSTRRLKRTAALRSVPGITNRVSSRHGNLSRRRT